MTDNLVKRLRDMVEDSKIYDDDMTLASIVRVIKREELLDESADEIVDCVTLPAQNDFEMREIARKALEGEDD
jgi:hypothetical protein